MSVVLRPRQDAGVRRRVHSRSIRLRSHSQPIDILGVVDTTCSAAAGNVLTRTTQAQASEPAIAGPQPSHTDAQATPAHAQPAAEPKPAARRTLHARRYLYNWGKHRPVHERPAFLADYPATSSSQYNINSFLGKREPHNGKFYVPPEKYSAFLNQYQAACLDNYMLFLTEVYKSGPYRYFLELDFDWAVPAAQVLSILPPLLQLIAQTVVDHFQLAPTEEELQIQMQRVAAEAEPQRSRPCHGEGAHQGSQQAVWDGRAHLEGSPSTRWPRCVLSMRTPHKVHLNFPTVVTTEGLALTCRHRIIQACKQQLDPALAAGLDWESIVDFPHGSFRMLGSRKTLILDKDPPHVGDKAYYPVMYRGRVWRTLDFTLSTVLLASIQLTPRQQQQFEKSPAYLDMIYEDMSAAQAHETQKLALRVERQLLASSVAAELNEVWPTTSGATPPTTPAVDQAEALPVTSARARPPALQPEAAVTPGVTNVGTPSGMHPAEGQLPQPLTGQQDANPGDMQSGRPAFEPLGTAAPGGQGSSDTQTTVTAAAVAALPGMGAPVPGQTSRLSQQHRAQREAAAQQAARVKQLAQADSRPDGAGAAYLRAMRQLAQVQHELSRAQPEFSRLLLKHPHVKFAKQLAVQRPRQMQQTAPGSRQQGQQQQQQQQPLQDAEPPPLSQSQQQPLAEGNQALPSPAQQQHPHQQARQAWQLCEAEVRPGSPSSPMAELTSPSTPEPSTASPAAAPQPAPPSPAAASGSGLPAASSSASATSTPPYATAAPPAPYPSAPQPAPPPPPQGAPGSPPLLLGWGPSGLAPADAGPAEQAPQTASREDEARRSELEVQRLQELHLQVAGLQRSHAALTRQVAALRAQLLAAAA